MLPPEDPASCPATIDPPGCVTVDAAVSVRLPLAVIVPEFSAIVPGAAGRIRLTAVSVTLGAVMLPPTDNGPLLSATETPSVTGPVTASAPPLSSENPPKVANPASVPTAFVRVSSAVLPEPCSVAAETVPPAPSVMLPVAISVTVLPVMLLLIARSPVTFSVTSGGSIAPVTVRLRASVSAKPVVAVNAPRFVTWFARPNAADAALPVSVVAVMTPPGCVIAPLATRLTVGAVRLAASARSPVTVSAIPPAPVSAPPTVRPCASVTAIAPVVVIGPSVPILLAPLSDRLPAVAVRLPTVSAPVPVSVTAPALSSVSVPMPDRLNAPPTVIAPAAALPTCSVAAVMADVVPAGTKLVSANAVPAVSGASATVPPAATRLPPACRPMLLLVSDNVGVAPPACTAPVTLSALPSTRLKLPALVKAPRFVTALPAAVSATAAAAPVNVVAVTPPPGCVSAPVAVRLTMGAVTVPLSVNAPLTFSETCAVSVNAPVCASAWLSARLKPPTLP